MIDITKKTNNASLGLCESWFKGSKSSSSLITGANRRISAVIAVVTAKMAYKISASN